MKNVYPRSQRLRWHRRQRSQRNDYAEYADTRFSNFSIEYLRENENFRDTVFVCSYGAQVESFKPKKWSKISWHCPFKYLQITSKLTPIAVIF